MEPSDAKKRADAKYRAKKVKQYVLSFFPADYDLYEYLQSKPNKAEYIRELIRADMEKEGGRG